MEASITFKTVGKKIGKNTILADLSFGVEKGSTFVLIGENGSGKSMILKLLIGLIEKDTGSVYSQVALFSKKIVASTQHLKVNRKDYATQRSLQLMVGQRRKLLTYLESKDVLKYRKLVKDLGLRR